MATKKITDLTQLTSGGVDRAADMLEIADVSASQSKKITPNDLMGISGVAIGDTDSQTLSNKTLTSPTINGVTFSGTLAGTYTIGGTPTFPSSVVTLTGSQTLTNKILTSPTINTATLVNPTLTVDTVAGFSASTTGTVYGVSITTGVIASAALVNTVNTAAIQSAAITATKIGTDASFAWTTYTPSWTSTGTAPVIGNGTLTGAFCQIGKTVFWRLKFIAGSTSTFGTGQWRFSIPVTSTTAIGASPSAPTTSPATGVGTWYGENPGVIGYGGIFALLNSTFFAPLYQTTTAGNLTIVGGSSPGVWASTWYMMASGSYEAA